MVAWEDEDAGTTVSPVEDINKRKKTFHIHEDVSGKPFPSPKVFLFLFGKRNLEIIGKVKQLADSRGRGGSRYIDDGRPYEVGAGKGYRKG